MGLFSFLKSSAKKTSEINDISKILGNQKSPKNLNELNDETRATERNLAYEKLFTLWEKHENLKEVFTEHNSNREQLEDIYRLLIVSGAGQWVKGHFVAVEALAFPRTLDYLLNNYNKMKQSQDDIIRVTFRLLEYFRKGEIGFIHPDE